MKYFKKRKKISSKTIKRVSIKILVSLAIESVDFLLERSICYSLLWL